MSHATATRRRKRACLTFFRKKNYRQGISSDFDIIHASSGADPSPHHTCLVLLCQLLAPLFELWTVQGSRGGILPNETSGTTLTPQRRRARSKAASFLPQQFLYDTSKKESNLSRFFTLLSPPPPLLSPRQPSPPSPLD